MSLNGNNFNYRNLENTVWKRNKGIIGKRIAYNSSYSYFDLLYIIFVYISNVPGENTFGL